jgi:hypothetical protein
MSVTQIAQEALALPSSERRRLIAQLVAADTEENRDLKISFASKIDDNSPEDWVSLGDLKARFAEG